MRTKTPETFKAIEEFVNEYTEKHGVSPTVREIHAGIGLAVGTVSRYLSFMRENGMIDYNGCRNITTRETKITKRETTRVPILGSVSCGVPKFAEENIEEYVRLPVALFGIDGYQKWINTASGRIHPNLMPMGTDTGRFAAQKPNLQNMPRKGGDPIGVRQFKENCETPIGGSNPNDDLMERLLG